jgi:hypothetical protein
MLKMGAPSKYSENAWASSVADAMMSRNSRRNLATSLSSPNRMSVLSVRSCASSIIITEYSARSGLVRNSRRSMPSVMYLTTVRSLVTSSKRIAYPTLSPSRVPISCATRAATLIAATRRGCVHPILPSSEYPT